MGDVNHEFDSQQIGYKAMDGDFLILTNHSQVLSIGLRYTNSLERYAEAEIYLSNRNGPMDLDGLIDLNRSELISWADIPRWHNLHAAIFKPDSLQLWIATDPPPATRGRWVGFSLTRELLGRGGEPAPQIVPALDGYPN